MTVMEYKKHLQMMLEKLGFNGSWVFYFDDVDDIETFIGVFGGLDLKIVDMQKYKIIKLMYFIEHSSDVSFESLIKEYDLKRPELKLMLRLSDKKNFPRVMSAVSRYLKQMLNMSKKKK